ncbi:hypothetical protein O6H91_12G083500 [Diphasiastrum complanatum]|uniref:Uncharacterized protein n=1 Tax=Diphasiastrum complanatum TaxID=34168 RepID=A0ACC2C4C3_DIPCM|nr:hypothetical protein O6H91_12G083500 [Diphasiastrum complanatum]
MATARSILQVIENYQKARTTFARTVAELASKPQNVEILHNAGVMVLLRPLLLDCVPQIQHLAALGLGRLASYSEELAEMVVSEKILVQILYPLREQNRHNKRAAANLLCAVAKHTEPLAQAVVDSGALDALVQCVEDFDPSVKEAGACALGNIARHSAKLAQAVVDARAVDVLTLCVQEPELPLRRASAFTLGEIAKHSPELAQVVVDADTVHLIANLVLHSDSKLKRQVCQCLSQIAKHSVDLAEVLVAADLFPKIFPCLKDHDPQVRRNASIVIREVVKHTPQLAQLIVAAGGLVPLIQNVADNFGSERLSAIMALGFIAAFDEALATTVITSNGIPPLLDALISEKEDHIKSATAWSLGQIGKHSPNHALAVAEAGVLPHLVSTFLSKASSEDLQNKCKKALKAVSDRLTHLPALDSLLQGPSLPEGIMKYVLAQLAKILSSDTDARTRFVTSGGFEKLQQLPVESGSELKELVDNINSAFPIELVHYYSPGYSELLLQKLGSIKSTTAA